MMGFALYLFDTGKLKLYAMRISDEILILGNGGRKKTRTYNEDPHLKECVTLLKEMDTELKSRLRAGTVTINKKELKGNLTFKRLKIC